MQTAQVKAHAWCVTRLESARKELADARSVFDKLREGQFNTNRATSLIRRANRRILFYEKVLAALENGYYIVPPFDVQAFAIRVPAGRAPKAQVSDARWVPEQKAIANTPVGRGTYKNPVVARSMIDETQVKDAAGKLLRTDRTFENEDWKDSIELPPMLLQAPEVIDCIKGVIEKKIFDSLGIAPQYRNIAPQYRSADPLIVGRINHWNPARAPLTFFIGWWLSEEDL